MYFSTLGITPAAPAGAGVSARTRPSGGGRWRTVRRARHDAVAEVQRGGERVCDGYASRARRGGALTVRRLHSPRCWTGVAAEISGAMRGRAADGVTYLTAIA